VWLGQTVDQLFWVRNSSPNFPGCPHCVAVRSCTPLQKQWSLDREMDRDYPEPGSSCRSGWKFGVDDRKGVNGYPWKS